MLEDRIEIIKVFKGGSLSSTKLINHPKFKKCVLKKVSNSSNREYGFVRFCSQIKRHSQLQSSEPELFPEIFEIGIDIKLVEKLLSFEHAYTHKKLFFTVYICDFFSGKPKALASQKLLWVKPNRLFEFPFPAANTKIIYALFKHLGIEKENP